MFSVLLVPTISMIGVFIIQADGFLLCCRQDQGKNFAPSGSRIDSVLATTSIRKWKKADEAPIAVLTPSKSKTHNLAMMMNLNLN